MKTNWEFDLVVDGELEINKTKSVCWLLGLASTAIDVEDWETAEELLERAQASLQGKLRLAEFYLNPMAEIGLSLEEKQRRAKQLLWELVLGEGECAGAACRILAPLYQATKPLRAIALRLKSDRLNGQCEPEAVKKLIQKMQRIPITTMEGDPYAAYLLASELEYCTPTNELSKIQKYLNQVAADSETGYFSGIAALSLAEQLTYEDPVCSCKYHQLAARLGNPSIICR